MPKLNIQLFLNDDKMHVHVFYLAVNSHWKLLLVTNTESLHSILFSLLEMHENWESYLMDRYPTSCVPFVNKVFLSVADGVPDISFSKASDDDPPLGEEEKRLLHEIHCCYTLLRERGVSTRTIREALVRRQTVSSLFITRDYRIILPDFDDLEIALTPLPKALYILYLRHLEGIAFKTLADYREELLELYARLAPSINPKRRELHVNTLVDPTRNSLNEKISQIRRAFADQLDESLISYYAISGEKGGVRCVRLSSFMITLPECNEQ